MTAASEKTGIARYREFLAVPHTRSLIGWGLLARMPLGMTPLALLLLARAEGASYGKAGALVGAYGLAIAVGGLVGGRRIDRRGPVAVLRLRGVVYPAFLVAAVVLAIADAPLVAIGAATVGAGLFVPPVSSSVRSIWPKVLPDHLRSTAYSVEASFQEVIFISGPLISGGLSAVEPELSVVATAATALVGTLQLIKVDPIRQAGSGKAPGGGLLGALESAGMRTLVLFAVLVGLGFGMVEVAMPAFAEHHGFARAWGAVALTTFSAGSMVGGLLAGAIHSSDDRRRLLAIGPALGLAMTFPLLGWSIPSMCVMTFLAGLPIAPTVGAVYGLIDDVSPRWAIAEAFAWFGTAVFLGVASGTALGGAVVDLAGIRWLLALPPLIVLAGVGLVFIRRRTLTAAAPPGQAYVAASAAE